jgi:hypothetical protein
MRQVERPLERTSIADIAVRHVLATVKYEIEVSYAPSLQIHYRLQ